MPTRHDGAPPLSMVDALTVSITRAC